ncbi:hypothetical protein BURMUCF2_A0137 [Burkholderia multivorans CF2]|nr:hypothetical protein BURMUCF2_A0137 [Burkholderia multivorans CF2]
MRKDAFAQTGRKGSEPVKNVRISARRAVARHGARATLFFSNAPE